MNARDGGLTEPATTLTPRPRRGHHAQIMTLFVVNLFLAVLWEIFWPTFGAADYLIGFVIGALALALYERTYGRRIGWLLSFVLFVIWEIIVSNLKQAWLILQPHPQLDPGIVAVPLTIRNNVEIIVLASVITLTPGTLSIDLHYDDNGQPLLFVHCLVVGDPENFRQNIKDNFERRLLLVTRGETA